MISIPATGAVAAIPEIEHPVIVIDGVAAPILVILPLCRGTLPLGIRLINEILSSTEKEHRD
jgi:hypothetical protein